MLHQIGAGASGPVFRAYDPDGDRLVAVKLLRLDLPPDRVHRLVAALDAIVAAELRHPALAQALVAGMVDVRAYLVQEFVAAESLDIVLRERGPLGPAEALRISDALAGALTVGAGPGLWHGALHPRDVLIGSDIVKLTGLGVAQALETAGACAAIRRPYTAPERTTGSWDGRADVFGLAALVYEMMSGRRIIGFGRRAVETFAGGAGVDNDRLRDALARALAEDPADRYDTAAEFMDEIRAALPGGTGVRAETTAGTPGTTAGTIAGATASIGQPDLDLFTVSEHPPGAVDPSEESETVLEAPVRADEFPADERRAVDEPIVEREEPVIAPTRFVESRPHLTGRAGEPALDPALDSTLDNVEIGLPLVDEPSDRTRAVWPLALALIVGLGVGFAGGYGVGNFQDARRPASLAAAAPPVGAVLGGEAVLHADESSRPAAASVPVGAASAPVARAAPTVVTAGRITVRSSPSGADVLLNGRSIGRTPVVARSVAGGAHTVRIVHEGYAAAERRVDVSRAHPQPSIAVALQKLSKSPRTPSTPAARRESRASQPVPRPVTAPRAGRAASPAQQAASLMFESRPSGASVFVDGRLVGTTPMLMSGVATGEHTVRLEKTDFQGWTSTVQVNAGTRVRVAASLEQR